MLKFHKKMREGDSPFPFLFSFFLPFFFSFPFFPFPHRPRSSSGFNTKKGKRFAARRRAEMALEPPYQNRPSPPPAGGDERKGPNRLPEEPLFLSLAPIVPPKKEGFGVAAPTRGPGAPQIPIHLRTPNRKKL
jgi:hypothetical protein